MVAEHEFIPRRRIGGVGDLSNTPVASLKSGAPPLVMQSLSKLPPGTSDSDYVQAPEFPGLWFYAGKLPQPGPGQPLVPPHLTDGMAQKLITMDPQVGVTKGYRSKILSPLAANLLGYYRGFQRNAGAAYAGGLAAKDPNRQSGATIVDKVTNLFSADGASKALSSLGSAFGFGGGKQAPAPAAPDFGPSGGEEGGFLDMVLSPVGIVTTVVLSVGGVVVGRKLMKGGRRRR